MFSTKPRLVYFWIPLLLLVSGPTLSIADEVTEPSSLTTQEKADQLSTIQRNIDWLERQITAKKEALSRAGKEDVAELQNELSNLESRIKHAKKSFVSIAADVEIPNIETDSRPKKRDLLQEAQQLVEPLFDAIRRVSEKPRRIEGYKTNISNLQSRMEQLDMALANIDDAIAKKKFPELEQQLTDSRLELFHERDEIKIQLDTFQRKLQRDMGDRRTVVEIITTEAQNFFDSKGRNLIIALIVFLSSLWFFFYTRRFVFSSKLLRTKLKPLSKPLELTYGLLAFLLSIFSVLFTLHFLNDWFLVTLITLFLIALIWSFKTLITVFVSEARLALNLGTVKQGERVIWQGLPWLVKSLGFKSVLINEALQGGKVILPARIVTSMLSRESAEDEPWFPTQVGDYVVLEDGVTGQIEAQTPETVVVRVRNAKKHYSATAFIAQNPVNLSAGFEIWTEVHTMQSNELKRTLLEVETELLKRVKSFAKIQQKMSASDSKMSNLNVGVTLDGFLKQKLFASARYSGELASERENLEYDLQLALSHAWWDLLNG